MRPGALIRADASAALGSGHVMRTLALAHALRLEGIEPAFLCREFPGDFISEIKARGFDVRVLSLPDIATEEDDAMAVIDSLGQSRADLIIADHYGLGQSWEDALKPRCKKLMAIDDTGRRHSAEILLDQNYAANPEQQYEGKLPAGALMLLGPAYALLRPEFAEARKRVSARDGRVRRVLVFFGASDLSGETVKTLHALEGLLRSGLRADVLTGRSNPHMREIEAIASGLPGVRLHGFVQDMAGLMMDADLYIGAPGTTTWERCALGLPSIVITTSQSQSGPVEELSDGGYIISAGSALGLDAEGLEAIIQSAIREPERLAGISRRSIMLVDGLGAGRTARALGGLLRESPQA